MDSSQHPPSPRQALAAVPWLGLVPAVTIDMLAAHAVLHRMPPGSILFEQSETPTFAQMLVAGSIELSGVRKGIEILVELVSPFDLLLPAAALNRQPYLLRAKVRDEALILMVEATAFRTAVAADHALCLAVLACQAALFRRQVKHIKAMALRSAEERVGYYLLGLFENSASGEKIRLPLEKRLLASQLGITRETLSRILPAIARYGIRVNADIVTFEDGSKARARFPTDPLTDGAEPIVPLSLEQCRGA